MSRRRRRIQGGAVGIIGQSLTSLATFTRASSATYLDGLQVLQTAATNVPRFSYNSTYGNPVYLHEGARTRRSLYYRNLTNAAWVKSNVAAAQNAVGIDGVANKASTLTATGTNGTILQSITLSSAARTYSAYVKRKTGTGTIEITDNNGTNYTDITSSINSSTFTRVQITRTQANPVIGFRIGTDTDEIIVDFAYIEDGSFASSPIDGDEAASAARAIDVNTTALWAWFNPNGFTAVVDYVAPQVASQFCLLQIDDGTDNNAYLLQVAAGGAVRLLPRVSGSSPAVTTSGTTSANERNRVAYTAGANYQAIARNGGAVVSGTNPTPSGLTTARTGARTSDQNAFSHFGEVTIYPFLASDSQLQALSAI